jgi:hypothetical protein
LPEARVGQAHHACPPHHLVTHAPSGVEPGVTRVCQVCPEGTKAPPHTSHQQQRQATPASATTYPPPRPLTPLTPQPPQTPCALPCAVACRCPHLSQSCLPTRAFWCVGDATHSTPCTASVCTASRHLYRFQPWSSTSHTTARTPGVFACRQACRNPGADRVSP